jgi:SAM-dependent methyltransferase
VTTRRLSARPAARSAAGPVARPAAQRAIRLGGTVKVIQFNWPKYTGAAAILAATVLASAARAPWPAVVALWAAAVPAVAWTVTSLIATWWVYDHRQVYGQLTAGLGEIGEWAAVHAGFDESAPTLRDAIGRPPAAMAEIGLRPGASLRRARGLGAHSASCEPASREPASREPAAREPAAGEPASRRAAACEPAAWPTEFLDSVFVTFAAHEVRDLAAQRALFARLRDALRPGGRLVVTEHVRDLANFAVYGPGAMHFQSLATWRARAAEAGLAPESEAAITPFVRRLVWRR